MWLILSIVCFLIFGFFSLKEKGERINYADERARRLSGGGVFPDGYKEYCLNCSNVAKVEAMIKEEESKLELTEEDEKDRNCGGIEWADDYLLKRKATKIVSTKIVGYDYLTRNQLAYYLTCREILDKGMKTNWMWGKPEEAEKMKQDLKKWFSTNISLKCDGYKKVHNIDIGYPVHMTPENGISVHFSTNRLSRPEIYCPFVNYETLMEKYGFHGRA